RGRRLAVFVVARVTRGQRHEQCFLARERPRRGGDGRHAQHLRPVAALERQLRARARDVPVPAVERAVHPHALALERVLGAPHVAGRVRERFVEEGGVEPRPCRVDEPDAGLVERHGQLHVGVGALDRAQPLQLLERARVGALLLEHARARGDVDRLHALAGAGARGLRCRGLRGGWLGGGGRLPWRRRGRPGEAAGERDARRRPCKPDAAMAWDLAPHDTWVSSSAASTARISSSSSTRSTDFARWNTACTRSGVTGMLRLSSQNTTLLSPLIGPTSISWWRPTMSAGTPEYTRSASQRSPFLNALITA